MHNVSRAAWVNEGFCSLYGLVSILFKTNFSHLVNSPHEAFGFRMLTNKSTLFSIFHLYWKTIINSLYYTAELGCLNSGAVWKSPSKEIVLFFVSWLLDLASLQIACKLHRI